MATRFLRAPTSKQRRQRALYQAIGTVKGFHGYLNNLQAVLHRAGLYKDSDYIQTMHNWLNERETVLRRNIRNIS